MNFDDTHMLRACELARRGEGLVEPNPMVGCVIAADDRVIGEGWHNRFGGPHAEVEALQSVRDEDRRCVADSTMYVTLEPCCFTGKTPPCTDAILRADIKRVVVAVQDPFPKVAGGGVEVLRNAGVDVRIGTGADASTEVLAPYLKRVRLHKPWVIAKWAMTLDGKIATHQGDSQWISSTASREIVHQLRGRVDAVWVGIGTALADDPLLTARPTGLRMATRVVLDTNLRLPLDAKLVQTASVTPFLLATSKVAFEKHPDKVAQLQNACVEVLTLPGAVGKNDCYAELVEQLLQELGSRDMTNVLVEGGGALVGGLFDHGQIDEAHVFVSPKIVGGGSAVSPIGGCGFEKMADAVGLQHVRWQAVDDDLYLHGRLKR